MENFCRFFKQGICAYKHISTINAKREHRDYPKHDMINEPAGKHLTLPGHDVSHLRGLVLEKVKSKDPYVLKAREHYLIQKFDTFRHGLNQEK